MEHLCQEKMQLNASLNKLRNNNGNTEEKGRYNDQYDPCLICFDE